MGKKSKEETA
jgi:hypothetical protein